MTAEPSRLATALGYARRGWSVFPLAWPTETGCSCGDATCSSPAKHPHGKLAPHGLKDATTDAATIRQWWTAAPDANIGINTEASGLVVLDVDPRHGGDTSLEQLEAITGPIETANVHTGGGGRHFIYQANGTPILSRPLDRERYPGLDVKACGGYVVAAGSDHVSGGRYMWGGSSAPRPIPSALLQILPKRGAERPVTVGGAVIEKTGARISDGERNVALASLAGRLRHAGLEPEELAAALQAANLRRCDRPLPEREVDAIARSVGRYPGELSEDEQRARRVTAEVERERARRAARRQLDAEEHGSAPQPEIRTLTERLATGHPALSWRIRNLQPVETRVMLAAQFKAGKTTLRDNLVRSLVDGDPFLGCELVTPITGNVAILDFEMGARQLDAWLGDQHIRETDRVLPIPLRGQAATFNILDEQLRHEWAARFRDRGVTYLILDCLRPVLDALGLDEQHEAGQFLVAFDALLAEAGITEALIVHHMGHTGERSRGDSRLRDWPDVEVRLVRQTDDPGSPRFLAAYGRDVDRRESELQYDPTTRRLTVAGGSRREAAARAVLPDVLAVLAPRGTELSGRQIKTALSESGHPRELVAAAIRLGISSGAISTGFGPRRAIIHRLGAGVNE